MTERGLIKLVPYVYVIGNDNDDVNDFIVAFSRLCT